MPDRVLPTPTPDWDRPIPTSNPNTEETAALRAIQGAGVTVSRSIVEMYDEGPSAARWNALADRFQDLADTCRHLADERRRTVALPPAGHEPEHDNQI